MLKAGIIGCGSISRAHRKEYLMLEKQGIVKLTCGYDIDPQAFNRRVKNNLGNSDQELEEHITFYTDLEEMLAKEELDFVDICIPTYLHKQMAIDLLKRGYHVLCEKPMALSFQDCQEMLTTAQKANKQLMIGQCLRFYPGFECIKQMLEENRYGKVLGAFFARLSTPPTWGWDNWFADPSRSGGAVTDLHIHDIDILRYLFGEPQAVSARATSSFCAYDTVHTSLFYDDVPVTAIADWSRNGAPFQAMSSIDCEKATLSFDGSVLTVYPKDGTPAQTVELEKISGYYGEIRYFCDVVSSKTENTRNSPASAATSVRLIEHIKQSADQKGAIVPFSAQ